MIIRLHDLRHTHASLMLKAGVANASGGVAEWTMAAVLKTANLSGFVGSNPTPSAKNRWLPKVRKGML